MLLLFDWWYRLWWHASIESAIELLGTWAPRLPKMGTPQRSTMIGYTGIRRLDRLSCLSDPLI